MIYTIINHTKTPFHGHAQVQPSVQAAGTEAIGENYFDLSHISSILYTHSPDCSSNNNTLLAV